MQPHECRLCYLQLMRHIFTHHYISPKAVSISISFACLNPTGFCCKRSVRMTDSTPEPHHLSRQQQHRSAARDLEGDEHSALRHHIPLAAKRPIDDGVGGGTQRVLHLHRLEHEQWLSSLDRLARLH